MENRDVQRLFQTFFNLKTSGSTDILQIDTAIVWRKVSDGFDQLFRILCIQTDRYGIDIAKFLEQNAFSLHNRHGGERAYITKAENCAAV